MNQEFSGFEHVGLFFSPSSEGKNEGTDTVPDIVELHLRELEMQAKSEKLQSLGLLAAGIAHDFSNLMTAVLGYTELARAEVPPQSTAGRHLAQASQGIRRAGDLARQLMAYSGKGSVQVRPVNLSQLILEIEGILQLCLKGRGRLTFNLAANLPDITADPIQLTQLVLNLVGNAADAISGRNSLVEVRTGFVDGDAKTFHECYPAESLPTESGRYVYVQVADNGRGIPAAEQRQIFEPFFSSKAGSGSSYGIGLSVVMGAVRRHHGAVRVESATDRGTTFTIYLPVFREPEPLIPGSETSSQP